MSEDTTDKSIIPFVFEAKTVRAVGLDGDPWFVAADVCAVLGLSNPSVSIQALDDDEKAKFNLGIGSDATIITEGGLYTLILRCRDATTPGTVPHRFRRWVTGDVLPAIRKTGRYGVSGVTVDDLLCNPKQLLALTQGYALQIEDMKRDMSVMQKDVDALDRIAGLEGNFGIRQSAKALSMPERKFVEYVQRIGWCFRQRGSNCLMGYADKDRAGLLTHKLDPYTKPDGSEGIRETLRFKPAGLVRLAKMLNVPLNLNEGATQQAAA